ncbi:hypothetical protein CLOM_g8069 [Closterium sp. NIES-68]|nr:hypothetical protein CLOM_g8069 [Closterium sp. NIES-68]
MATATVGLWTDDRLPSVSPPFAAGLASDLAKTEEGRDLVTAADGSAAREPIRCAPFSALGGRGQSATIRPLRFPRDPESEESPDDSATTSSASDCDHAEAGFDCDPGGERGGGGGGGVGAVGDAGVGSLAHCGVTSMLRFRNLSYSVASGTRKSACRKSKTSKVAPLPQDESAAIETFPVDVEVGSGDNGNTVGSLKSGSWRLGDGIHSIDSFSSAGSRLSSLERSISKQIGARKNHSRRVLVDINGCARSGEITAIMGASGAGKTTLLNILACRIASGRRAGEVELDGLPVRSGMMRRASAYVMQDDLMFPSLTVRETLMFAAELRLPQSVGREEKAAKVARLLDLLGLADVAETRIGDEGQRRIRGERKRVAIGTEIICDPKILFLDEPTSGLDSTSAFRVVRAIKDIAINTNSIAVMVLHQPSFRVLSLVDRLLLLASGHTVFHGAPPALPRFLASVGFPVPQFANSTEFALDLIEDMQRSSREVADFVGFAREYARQQEEEEAEAEREWEKRRVGFAGEATVQTEKIDSLQEHAALRYKLHLDGCVQMPGLDKEEGTPEGMPEGTPEKTGRGGADETARCWNSSYFQLPSARNEPATNEDVETGGVDRAGESGKAPCGCMEKGWGWGVKWRGGGDGKEFAKAGDGVGETRKYGNAWFAELAVLTRRNALITFRTPALYLLRLGLIAITGDTAGDDLLPTR